ncbi:MAG: DUF2924 domain-containing protein [Candidatus Margulisiibacteriota bacterium]
MKESILTQIMQLEKMSTKELVAKYNELFGDTALPQNNKPYLFKRIAYKLQEIEYGGLSEQTKSKIHDLIQQEDPINSLGNKKKRITAVVASSSRDGRLPFPGTVITKHYKDKVIEVTVLEKGFEYNGKPYKSLSKIAGEVTGTHWSGFAFFGIKVRND